ncbi:Rhodanese-related sulfurtransferase [Butyrivibrio hungatei DSM 14810]|uniref:Rhodanese-related sulfurtransferase n=1 Tax=Butyrivibrio hungatei DSM 14810 TaxID=1121132 RepID=A0A1M7RTW1_9FIRM|nr:rhodanese-like domain-containing protein [Butyrivibrio hungatei]SHN49528.1 Rhodanese-related sulfurtransferase [Butyrivibrio hungatei DSM 14810]
MGNILKGLTSLFKHTDINENLKEFEATPDAILLDVRTKEEYKSGHISGSINIPVDDILEIEDKIPDHDTMIFVYCHSGNRARRAVDKMKMLGYKKAKNIGGIVDYKGLKVL